MRRVIEGAAIINIVINFLNLNEILPAVALGLNIGCVWFLARSFLTIGFPILWVLGMGALCEKAYTLFGVRWELVEATIKQKAEVVYGLLLFLLAIILEIVILSNSLKPSNWYVPLIMAIIPVIVFIEIGHRTIVPVLKYCFFMRNAKKSLFNSKASWLKLNHNKRNGKIAEQVKCYHLGKFYEKFATKKLQKYLEKLGNMKNGKFEKRHIDKYGMKKET
jgi:hypothetical protein